MMRSSHNRDFTYSLMVALKDESEDHPMGNMTTYLLNLDRHCDLLMELY